MRNSVVAAGAAAVCASLVVTGANAQSASTQAQGKNWQASFTETTSYISWNGSRGYPYDFVLPGHTFARGSGSEVYTQPSFQLKYLPNDDWKIEFLARTGYVSAHQTTGGLNGSVTTFTDSSLSTTLTYYGFNGFQPYASLALNLPTGSSALYGTSAFARMDPDIFDIGVFGEGLNVAPTIGVNVPIGDSMLFGFSAGYTNRGKFNRESNIVIAPQTSVTTDPGDVFTVTPSLGIIIGDLTLQTSFSYSTETPTYVNGVKSWKAGDRYALNGSASYDWSKTWNSTLSLSFSHSGKQHILQGGAYYLEPLDSNSNVYQANLETTAKYGAWSVGPTLGILYRDRNGYDSTDFVYVPAKTKISLGGLANYKVTETGTLTFKAQHLWISENDQDIKSSTNNIPFAPIPGTSVPHIDGNAWVFTIAGNLAF